MLGDFENKAAPVYERLLEDDIPPIGDQRRADFAGFLAVSYMRTPTMRPRLRATRMPFMTKLSRR
jgi:hypothetical protein